MLESKLNKIPFYLFTCDKYLHLLPYFADCFNRHWGDWKQINILGFTPPTFNLPNNFSFISLGDQNLYGRDWGKPLINFFAGVNWDYFGMFWDDLFPIGTINFELLEEGLYFLLNNKVDRLYFQVHNKCKGQYFNENFKLINQNGEYRYSVQPSIWKTSDFKKGLKTNQSCWDFEVNNSKKSFNDGKRLIYPIKDIMPEFNVYEKGKFRDKTIQKFINGWDKFGKFIKLEGKDLEQIMEIRNKYYNIKNK